MFFKLNNVYFLKENTKGLVSENKVSITLVDNLLNFNFEIIDDEIFNPYQKDNDNLYKYDVVEVFISFDNNCERYFEYELSPFGVRFLGIINNPTHKVANLELIKPDFIYKTNIFSNGYKATISIDINKIDNFSLDKILFNCFNVNFNKNKRLCQYAKKATRLSGF